MEEIQTPIFVIGKQLIKHGLIPANQVDGEGCISGSKNSENLKSYIQKLINQGTFQIRRWIKEEEEVFILEISYPTLEV